MPKQKEQKREKLKFDPKALVGKNLAVIRIKGQVRVNGRIVDTLSMLNLHNKLHCSVFKGTPPIIGMLDKVKNFTTFGEIDDSTLKELKEKREEIVDGKPKKFFRLHPPIGGFERKGTKVSFNAGGALGYRGVKINDLIKRMLK